MQMQRCGAKYERAPKAAHRVLSLPAAIMCRPTPKPKLGIAVSVGVADHASPGGRSASLTAQRVRVLRASSMECQCGRLESNNKTTPGVAAMCAVSSSSIQSLVRQVQETYRRYPLPWVVGYSGGKDSTAVLQLIWTALSQMDPSELQRPIFVLSSNTGVENPLIEGRIGGSVASINETAAASGLPITAVTVRPEAENSFWVNLIGRGYPAPTTRFRWCTGRLKIDPVSAFVRAQVAEYGEVIMVLGVRAQESATRAQTMSAHAVAGTDLRRHSQLTGAYVYAPIETWSADDVWTFLLQVSSPWGDSNRDLAALYRSASGEECPLVVDTTTPSCGNSRFGCWVCTVASKDSSMAALVDDGQDWLQPLLEFRDYLFETTDPERKREFRDTRGRNGRVQVKRDGTLAARSYTLETSRHMLAMLLSIEAEMKSERPEIEILSREELQQIRKLWVYDRHDWGDSLPEIARNYGPGKGEWPPYDDLGFDGAFLELLSDHATRDGLPIQLLTRVLEAERHAGVTSRRGIHQAIRKTLELDWRDESEILTSYASYMEEQS